MAVAGGTLPVGGNLVLPVRVERDGYQGPIDIRAEGLPASVTAEPVIIPAGRDSAELNLFAAPEVEESVWQARLLASADRIERTMPLQVSTVKKASTLQLLPLDDLTLLSGESKPIEVQVVRKGFKGRIQLAVEGLPPKVNARPQTAFLDAAADKVTFVLTADDDAEAAASTVWIRSGGAALVEVPLRLTVQKAPTFRLKPMFGLTLTPGERKTVLVRLERRGFKGPIDVSVAGPLNGVRARAVRVPPGQNSALLEFTVPAEAGELKQKVQLTAESGSWKDQTAMTVTVLVPKAPVIEPRNLVKAGEVTGKIVKCNQHTMTLTLQVAPRPGNPSRKQQVEIQAIAGVQVRAQMRPGRFTALSPGMNVRVLLGKKKGNPQTFAVRIVALPSP
jgi:hypothetical protein